MTLRALFAAAVAVSIVLAAGCVSRKVAPGSTPGALRILSLTAEPETIFVDEQSVLTATVDNPSGSPVTYSWAAAQGSINGDGPSARYFGSYCCALTDYVVLTVRNGLDEKDTKLKVLTVYQTTR